MNVLAKAIARFRREARARHIRKMLADPQTPSILCASIGRVGSNMLHRGIIEGRARSISRDFLPSDIGLIGTVAWDLDRDTIPPGSVAKTHDLPYALKPQQGLRIVFSFGRPSDTVLSVIRKSAVDGDAWRDRHLSNLHASGSLDEIVERDVLRLEEQLDAWRAVTDIPMLAIHYGALWDAGDILEDFLGFPVPLPPRRSRGAEQMDPELIAKVRQSYARLDDIVDELPRYWRSGELAA